VEAVKENFYFLNSIVGGKQKLLLPLRHMFHLAIHFSVLFLVPILFRRKHAPPPGDRHLRLLGLPLHVGLTVQDVRPEVLVRGWRLRLQVQGGLQRREDPISEERQEESHQGVLQRRSGERERRLIHSFIHSINQCTHWTPLSFPSLSGLEGCLSVTALRSTRIHNVVV
jgi:hypothetical protein